MKEELKIEGKLPSELVEEIRRLHRANHFAALLEIEIAALGPGYCRLLQQTGIKCNNLYGGVHGGVTATLVDISMGVAVRTLGLQPVTAELTVNYLKPVQSGEELATEGKVIHRGSKILLTESVVTCAGQTVAMGRGLFMTRGSLTSRQVPPEPATPGINT